MKKKRLTRKIKLECYKIAHILLSQRKSRAKYEDYSVDCDNGLCNIFRTILTDIIPIYLSYTEATYKITSKSLGVMFIELKQFQPKRFNPRRIHIFWLNDHGFDIKTRFNWIDKVCKDLNLLNNNQHETK